jgi:hypothetical protein
MLKNEQNPAKSHKDGYLISNNHKKTAVPVTAVLAPLSYPINKKSHGTCPPGSPAALIPPKNDRHSPRSKARKHLPPTIKKSSQQPDLPQLFYL